MTREGRQESPIRAYEQRNTKELDASHTSSPLQQVTLSSDLTVSYYHPEENMSVTRLLCIASEITLIPLLFWYKCNRHLNETMVTVTTLQEAHVLKYFCRQFFFTQLLVYSFSVSSILTATLLV